MLPDNNPNGYGYTEPDTEPEEINYDSPYEDEDEPVDIFEGVPTQSDLIMQKFISMLSWRAK